MKRPNQEIRFGRVTPKTEYLLAFLSHQFSDPNLILRFPITTLRFLQHQFGYPQPYFMVPHYHSTLSSAPVQLSPTLPYGSPLPLYAFFSTSSVIPNLTLRFPITTLRFLQHQFGYPQPYLTVPHHHSTLSSAPVQLTPTLPHGSPLPLYAFFSTSSVIPNLTLRFPITTLRFLQHQFSYPQPYLTVPHYHSTLSSEPVQLSPTLPYGSPLPLYAFFSTSSVIPNLTLRFPITTLRFLQHQFGYPQPYLTVPHYHSTLSSAPVQLSHNLTLRFPITTLRFLQHQFSYPQPYLTVPHYHSTLSSAPVQLSPTLPYGSPLPLYAFFSTSSVIPNLTLRFPITTLRFLQHQFSYPQPYLTVPHYHSTLSSAPVQLSPTLPYGSPSPLYAFFSTSSVTQTLPYGFPLPLYAFFRTSSVIPTLPYGSPLPLYAFFSTSSVIPTLPYGSPLPLYAFFSTSSVIPNLILRFPITTLRFFFSTSSVIPNLTLRFPITTLRFLLNQFSYQLFPTLPYGSPLPLYAFFSTSSVIPNLTLRFPITTLRFLQHQFGYPQPYLTVPHYHSTLSSAPVQLFPTLPYGSPLPLYAFFSTISVIPNLTLRFPITTLRFLQHQFGYPQPYLTVPHYHSTLSSAPVQLSPTLPYGSPLPLYAFFSTSSVIPNLTLRFPITTLRFLQFSYPQPYLTVPHYHSTLSSAPVQLSPTLPYGSPLPLYAFFSTSSVIPNLTLRFPITTLRFLQHQFGYPNLTLRFPITTLSFLQHQFSYPQPYLTVPHHHSTLPHHHSTLSSAPVRLSQTLPYGSPLPLYAFFSTSSVIPNLTLRFPITTLRFLQHQFSYPKPYVTVPHYHSTLSFAPVQLFPTLPYGSPLPTLRFLQHQFSYPQPYLTVPHYHSTLSSAPVQLSPTLPYGSPSPLYAFFSTSSVTQTLPYGFPLPLYAFFRTISVIPNLTLRFPITTLRFLQHQFSYPQPYLAVPHYHSTLSSAPVQLSPTFPVPQPLTLSYGSPYYHSTLSSAPFLLSPTLPYGSPLPLYAFFSTSSVIPNLTLWFPITTLRFLQHQFSYPQPYLTVPHYLSTLSFAPVQLFSTLPYGSPLPLYAFFSTISVIPNLTLRFPITTLRFLQHQFSYPQPYLTVPHHHSTLSSAPVRLPKPYLTVSHHHSKLSSAPVQLSTTLPHGSPSPLYAFFSTSSVIPNLTLRFPITTLRFLQHQFSYPQPYLAVPHYHSTLSSAPVQLSPNLTLRFPITTLSFLSHQFS